jgi:putative DNA primase/helicase
MTDTVQMELEELTEGAQESFRNGEMGDGNNFLRAIAKLLPPNAETNPDPTVRLIKACTIEPESIDWLWEGWLPGGKLVILAGQPGTGKTTVALALAATTTIAGRFPDGSKAEIGSVVIWSGEDGIADTLVPRLMVMGADMSKIYFVTGTGRLPFDPSKDMLQLSQQIRLVPDIKLVIIDPVVSVISGDSHKNAEVRKGLQPLIDLGLDTGACILGISHFNKSGGNTSNPLDLISGSIAFAAVARVVLGAAKLTTPDEEHGHSRIFCRIKSNIGPDEDGVGYDLRMGPLSGQTCIEASTVVWGQYVSGHSRDLLSQVQLDTDSPKSNTRSSEAICFLQDLLSNGAVAQRTIEEEAAKAGIADKTLRRAKKSLNVLSKKNFSGWTWELVIENKNQDGHLTIKKKHDHLDRLDHLDSEKTLNMAKMPNTANKYFDENVATLKNETGIETYSDADINIDEILSG